jgi:hypothetical protein
MIQRLADLSADDASLGEDMAKTADKLATAEVKQAAKDQGADLSKNLASRKTSGALLEILASAFSDAIIHRSGGGRELINTDQAQAVRTLAERFEADALADIVDQLNRYEALLWRNLNQKTLWDNVVITCRTAQLLQI